MKRKTPVQWLFFFLLPAALLCSGCIVRSIYPWLAEETRVADATLAGGWHDAEQEQTAFFVEDGKDYKVLLVGDGDETLRFEARLHNLDGVSLLVVGPDDKVCPVTIALLPGYLLLRVERKDDTMKIYTLDTDSLPGRLQKSAIKSVGNKADNYIVFSSTAELTAFVRSQLQAPGFFNEEPVYTFSLLP